MAHVVHNPIHSAVNVDGVFGGGPKLQDLLARNIVAVLPVEYIDILDNNTRKDGWEVIYMKPKAIRAQHVLFRKEAGLNTIAEFKAALESWLDNEHKTFQIYNTLRFINIYRPVKDTPDILVNNAWVNIREYVPTKGWTNLHIDFGNTIANDIYTVDGDQSTSTPYYYAGVYFQDLA